MARLDTKRLAIEVRRSARPVLLLAGLIVAGLVAGGIILKNQTFQKPWEDYYDVRADFDDVKGVTPGSQQVRMAGVQIGIIKKAELENGHAILTLAIRSKYRRLYRDARMRLRPATPLQDMFVEVQRGTPSAGVLQESDVLPAERTESPVDIARVMNTFDDDTRQRLGVLLDGLGTGLADRGASLRQAFAESVPFLDVAKRATGVIARRRAVTKRLVANLSALTGTLAGHDNQLANLIGDGEATLATLARDDRHLSATVRELPTTVSAMRGAFASVRRAEGDLDPALRSLDPVVSTLRSGLESLARFGRDARPALAALRPPVRNLRTLSRDLAPTARALGGAVAPLVDQTSDFDRVTALMPPCFAQMSRFFNNTMSFLKFEDEGGTIPRAEPTFSLDSLTPVIGASTVTEPTYRKMPTCTPGGQKP